MSSDNDQLPPPQQQQQQRQRSQGDAPRRQRTNNRGRGGGRSNNSNAQVPGAAAVNVAASFSPYYQGMPQPPPSDREYSTPSTTPTRGVRGRGGRGRQNYTFNAGPPGGSQNYAFYAGHTGVGRQNQPNYQGGGQKNQTNYQGGGQPQYFGNSEYHQGGGRQQNQANYYPRNKSPNHVSNGEQPQPSQPPPSMVARQSSNASRSHSSGTASSASSSSPPPYYQNSAPSYPPYWDSALCLLKYSVRDANVIRGKLRVLPGKETTAFVACDRGTLTRDVIIPTSWERNRALDGDLVFVELLPEHQQQQQQQPQQQQLVPKQEELQPPVDAAEATTMQNDMAKLDIGHSITKQNDDDDGGDIIVSNVDEGGDIIIGGENWQDDSIQMQLWNPAVTIAKPKELAAPPTTTTTTDPKAGQRRGRVVHVVPPKSIALLPSEINPSVKQNQKNPPPSKRNIVGRLVVLKRQNGDVYLMKPVNQALPEFKCMDLPPPHELNLDSAFHADYIYGSWKEGHKWPPCFNVRAITCHGSTVEVETAALLPTYGVDHGEFTAEVLHDVDLAVQSGVYTKENHELEWAPTPDMLVGRRDYRQQRIFTIDPSTARDLDDALHIQTLPDGRIEIGVHIADVSHFIQPDSEVDREAQRRATTVYLVDRVIPMLPRPLCEIACSLNENVERLAFSCVWTINSDGTMATSNKKQEIWYGRTVIKSCARLDYATAQNMIDGKVATGEVEADMDESLWPLNRRPTGGHTVDQVAADVRLMHRVAMARRRLRFQNGALALNGVKLTFQLDSDGETPLLCSTYPIRDSNRLVEEYMLLANFLAAQRLATHAGGLAVLRRHPPPLMEGIQKVVDLAKVAIGFDMDATSSQSIQKSLNRLTRECDDEVVLQCITALLTVPMQPALYFPVRDTGREFWQHFALHIPYYTHFTSPIRRYPDVLVHCLLQATLDGEKALESFSLDEKQLQIICDHCNDKKDASRSAQQRGDIIFLALYLKRAPLSSQLGVVLSVGVKTFSLYVPSLGLNKKVFLDEHDNTVFSFTSYEEKGNKCIKVESKKRLGTTNNTAEQPHAWTSFHIKIFTKILVTCTCKDKFPIDVKVLMEGPWVPELRLE